MDAWVSVGNEHRLGAAADDLVGEGALGGVVFSAWRAEDLVHRDRVDVANEGDSRKREQVGVEESLDGRLRGVLIDAALEEQALHILVGPGSLQQRKQGLEAAEGEARFAERAEAVSARLYEEGLLVDAGGGVALAEDRHAALLAAEVVAEPDEFLGQFGSHLRSPRRWRPSCRARASRRPWRRDPSWPLPCRGRRRPGCGWPCGGPSSRRG